MNAALLTLEVAYALPGRQTLLTVRVAPGTSIGEALAASGIFELHPETRDAGVEVGVFGKILPRDHRPADGDRIEIYRPLIADPKASRNARVAKKRQARENFRNMRA
jgi:putative ubiquitin-RnfH superfamily antitoxin RatB of RatAB toxin-antitoxin module